jgi:acylphosphatase
MQSTSAAERRLVHYSGHVQGVGFRFTAKSIAASYAVSGYVQNLADGRVQLLAEGTAKELNALLQAIRSQIAGQIEDEHSEILPATGEFTGFNIHY